MSPIAPTSLAGVTTEQIQKCLDENKQLILAILDNRNLGKLAECAQYQSQLQKNLMYLAAIADSQPPSSPVHPQQGNPVGQQAPVFPSSPSLSFNPHQIHHQP
ncbi:hypothetical protein KFK09_011338 [Dendrobium nobile]|uniref:SS18 N-terminal domain-containing protein n=1 Tax=Dendrobium nobile TaxID=94219 RepID=A0A8T3BCD0_DENNO|nr:hypothetical protein KFK09_011338 [Dendrobium nobile]